MITVNGFDKVTGEFINEFRVNETMEETQSRRDNAKHRKSSDQTNVFMSEKFGNFCFMFSKLDSVTSVDKPTIIRFLYLCSFMDFEQKLCLGNQKTDAKYMTFEEIPGVLRLTKKIGERTRDALIENGLISIDEEDHIIVNKEYCLKGRIAAKLKDAIKTRLFDNSFKDLYEKSKANEHKKLYMLVKLLPFVNFYHNEICGNADVKFKRQIIPMNLKQIAEVLDYSPEHVSRLKKDLLSLKVNGEYVVAITETGKSQKVTINPRVYYRGTGMENLEPLYHIFSVDNL